MTQLVEQVRNTLSIFEHTHPDCVSVFVFDQSSAHKGFADNALNINSMNLHLGGKQKKLCDTIILLNNPDPAPGEEDSDTCRKVQHMCFPKDHPNPKLQGQPKGIRAVLEEWKSIWDKYNSIYAKWGTKVSKKCASCMKSQVLKDVEQRIEKANEMDQQGEMAVLDTMDEMMAPETMDKMPAPETETPPAVVDEWCCMYQILSLQDDFLKEKPII